MTCKFVHYMLIYVIQYIILSQKNSANKIKVLQECFLNNLDLWTDKNGRRIFRVTASISNK